MCRSGRMATLLVDSNTYYSYKRHAPPRPLARFTTSFFIFFFFFSSSLLFFGTHESRMDSACLRSRVQLDEFRVEIQRRDQEILAMGAKMKTLEEQHQDYQRHIAVLKESLCAKEEHYNMLQADCEELRQRLEEKNRIIEKKTQQVQQERQRAAAEIAELREHMDIKDRKINVLQRKVRPLRRYVNFSITERAYCCFLLNNFYTPM